MPIEESGRVAIYLTPEEIELFKSFREHQDRYAKDKGFYNQCMVNKDNVNFLLDGDGEDNIFNLRKSAITLHIDEKGIIQSIEVKKWRYRKKKLT
jgi:hypothetical protein